MQFFLGLTYRRFQHGDKVYDVGGSVVRILLPVQETQVQSLGQEDPLEEETATHLSILVLEIPWTQEPEGLRSMRLQRVRHN